MSEQEGEDLTLNPELNLGTNPPEDAENLDGLDINAIKNSQILGLQTTLDIHALLKEGLSREGVLNLMMFRAQLIQLLFLYASSTSSTEMEKVFTPLFDEMVLDNEKHSKEPQTLEQQSMLERRNLDYSSTEDVNWVVNRLMLEAFDSEQLIDPATANEDWALHFDSLYHRFSPPLPSLLLAKEVVTQILDMSNGTGIWSHKAE